MTFSGGIILGFLTAAAAGSSSSAQFMASEHYRPQLYNPNRAMASGSQTTVFKQTVSEQNVPEKKENVNLTEEEENEILFLLLEAFPGVSLESLAVAYAKADRDPNRAAEILTLEVECNAVAAAAAAARSDDEFTEFWDPPPNPNLELDRLSIKEEEEYERFDFSARPSTGMSSKNYSSSSSSSRDGDTQQVKNGHGDFAGASVWRDSPTSSAAQSMPPESYQQPWDDSANLVLGHLVKPKWPEEYFQSTALRRSKKTSINSHPSGARSSSAPPSTKLSAAAGSVSNQMQRRPSPELPSQRSAEGNNAVYPAAVVKRKGKGDSGNNSDSGSGGSVERERMAAEDFIHSMVGAELGIDTVRDVMDHFQGDTEKALETLLNIGSTTAGIKIYSGNSDTGVLGIKKFSSLNHDAERYKPASALLRDSGGLGSDPPSDEEESVGKPPAEEENLLKMLIGQFPNVEEESLAQILQAAGFNYMDAVLTLRESGMTPIGEQNSQSKLDPKEVLQALFKTESGQPIGAAPSGSNVSPVPPLVTEQWSTVAAKPRPARDPGAPPDVIPMDPSEEYARHRTTANEHWETMKSYMKQANLAYQRGDRVHAGLLSEQGNKFHKLALEASARASQNIFNVRNKDIENNITIDLHSQHVKEAVKLLQLHLKALCKVPSVCVLTVITGQGAHSADQKARIKPAVTRYLDKKEINWEQVNSGCIAIRMSDVRAVDPIQRESDSSFESD